MLNELIHIPLGRLDYDAALDIQQRLVGMVQAQPSRAFLLSVEHVPPVITLGRNANHGNILASPNRLAELGISVRPASRGGDVTYHGPGQLVLYPIMRIDRRGGLRQYIHNLEQAVIVLLNRFNIAGRRMDKLTGVWTDQGKIAAIGVAVSRWVAYHGLAINVCPKMDHFDLIIPCGLRGWKVASMAGILGKAITVGQVLSAAVQAFAQATQFQSIRTCAFEDVEQCHAIQPVTSAQRIQTARQRLPTWLAKPIAPLARRPAVERILRDLNLATVCGEARCPNRADCWAAGTAAFMILGRSCTRSCQFCAVQQGKPEPVDDNEPAAVARACQALHLQHVVITSVTRDDLSDGGAGQFASVIAAVRRCSAGVRHNCGAGVSPACGAGVSPAKPHVTIEVLTPDFQGRAESVEVVIRAGCDVFNHNIETVPRLYAQVRPQADYERSLGVLRRARQAAQSANHTAHIKSGLMVGLGERDNEVLEVMCDLRQAGCDILTIGQYLRPSASKLPVAEYIPPSQFKRWKLQALEIGFAAVAAGPFVRSSFQAHEVLEAASHDH